MWDSRLYECIEYLFNDENRWTTLNIIRQIPNITLLQLKDYVTNLSKKEREDEETTDDIDCDYPVGYNNDEEDEDTLLY